MDLSGKCTADYHIKQIDIIYFFDKIFLSVLQPATPMDTQNLQAFLAVARHLSFSNAAEELHLTQPAISKRIALLEQDLDLPLFNRIGRRVSLTRHAEQLIPLANDILDRLDSARRELLEQSEQVSGRLTLAISHHIGLHHLPPVLRAFQHAQPNVELDISFTDSELAYAAVLSGEAELAVITLAPQGQALIEAVKLWQDPLCFAVAKDHPLAVETARSIDDLSQFPAILPNQSTYTGTIIAGLFAQKKLKLNIRMATNYLETIKAMASIGLGWTVLPETMLDDSLQKIEISGAKLARELGYIRHRDRHASMAVLAFIATLQEFAGTTD